jgi:hypothetical protein
MKRSPNAELAKRTNAAMSLLEEGASNDEIISALMHRFGVSERQAYRYIQDAMRLKHHVPIPEQKIVFTVKLPKSLVSFLRHFADSTGDSLSNIVTHALTAFLKRKGHGRETL